MRKILILYFSGVGATKRVAELMLSSLSQEYETDLFSIENSTDFRIKAYDALVIGTPVHHTAPAHFVTNFFDSILPLAKPIPAFIYSTFGLYSCNTNRILAKQLKIKNIITIIDREYRSPTSDGSLLIPAVKRFFEFDKNLNAKIILDCARFAELLKQKPMRGYIPRFRFSGILNAPNKLAGQLTTFTIYLHRESCVKCGRCISGCPHKALDKDNVGYPLFQKNNCENCYRCIHHCPQLALSLNRRKKIDKVIKYD